MDLKVNKVQKITGTIKAPASKSYSHRAFIAAALAEGESILRDPLYSEDTLATLEACEQLGALFQRYPDKCIVQGTAGYIRTPENVIDVKNSGTSVRILCSLLVVLLLLRCLIFLRLFRSFLHL